MINTLLEDRRHNRNIYELLDLLSSGKKVSEEKIYQMLMEDRLINEAVDEVILEMVEDNQLNRMTDRIVMDLEKGRIYRRKGQFEEEKHQVRLFLQ